SDGCIDWSTGAYWCSGECVGRRGRFGWCGCVGWYGRAARGLREGEQQAGREPAGVALVLGVLRADAPLHSYRGPRATLLHVAVQHVEPALARRTHLLMQA